jgi:RsiW-degrading membrane proteinase PrsW (M82 family)
MTPDFKAAADIGASSRTPVAFIAGLAICSLGGLAALIIAVRGGPVPALIGLGLAVLPIPLVMAGVLYLDRLEPEPRGLLAVVFGAGAGVAAVVGLAGHVLGNGLVTTSQLDPNAGRVVTTTLGAALAGAVVAESLKGAVLVSLLLFHRLELDGATDGVVYGSMTGLGFALIANLYAYVQAEHAGPGALASAFAQRGILSPLWGPLFSSIIGIGVAYAAMRPRYRGIWAVAAGWVGAVALHTIWDDTVGAPTGKATVVYVILLGVLAALLALMVADRRRIVALITRYLPAYEAPGVVTAPDVDMLASLRWRRLARQWARLHRGLSGVRAMSDYQLAATELALACNRAGLDLMDPAAFGARRAESLAQMRAAVSVFRDRYPALQPPPWASDTVSAFAGSPLRTS